MKVSSLSIIDPSVEILPLSFVWLSHTVSVTFFQVDNPFYYFFLGHYKPILIITLCGLPHIFSVYFSLIFSVKLFCSSCVTVTQSACNIFLFPSVQSTLLFPLSHWWPVLMIMLLQILAHFVSGIITLSLVWMSHKFYVKESPFPLSELSAETVSISFVWIPRKVLFFPFESFMISSYSYAVCTDTHIFFSV